MGNSPPLTESDKWTLGDLLTRVKLSHLASCIAAIAALAVSAFALGEKFGGRSAVTDPPAVEFATGYTSKPRDVCGKAAREELELAKPTKLLPLLVEQGVTSNFATIGPITVWVSCVEAQGGTVIYTGAAGVDGAEAQIQRSRFEAAVSSRLDRTP